MDSNVFQILDSVYRLRADDHEWMTNVLEALRPKLDRGLGLLASMIDARVQPNLVVERVVPVGMEKEPFEQMETIISALQGPDERMRLIFALPEGVGTASEVMGDLFASMPHFDRLEKEFPVRDFFGMVAADPGGLGCVINAPLREREQTDDETRFFWGRVNAHIAAALRLRKRVPELTTALEGDIIHDSTLEAIIGSSGRVEHATGAAESKDSRALLEEAAGRRVRARIRIKNLAPHEALDGWGGLIDGRWTLIDHLDCQGRRFVLARRNEPGTRRLPMLTVREAQVVGFAMLGHSPKLIHHELGITQGAVTMRLKSAYLKLGVRSQVELIAKLWRPEPKTEPRTES